MATKRLQPFKRRLLPHTARGAGEGSLEVVGLTRGSTLTGADLLSASAKGSSPVAAVQESPDFVSEVASDGGRGAERDGGAKCDGDHGHGGVAPAPPIGGGEPLGGQTSAAAVVAQGAREELEFDGGRNQRAWLALEYVLDQEADKHLRNEAEAKHLRRKAATVLTRTIEMSEDQRRVIEQLRAVVVAQHAKIEELRDPIMKDDGLTPKVQWHLLSECIRHESGTVDAHSKAHARARRLTGQLRDLRKENADLKRLNRRCAGMLAQVGPDLDFSPFASVEDSQMLAAGPSVTLTASVSDAALTRLDSYASLGAATAAGAGGSGPEDAGSGKPPWSLSPRVPPAAAAAGADAAAKNGRHGPSGSSSQRLSAAARSAMMLWSEQEPRGLLRALLHNAGRLCEQSLTLYVVDPWLRASMADNAGASAASGGAGASAVVSSSLLKPTLFYLDSGRVTLHAFRRDGLRAEPPRFTEIASLPVMAASGFMALPLQAGPGRPVLAAMQITGDVAQSPTAGQSEQRGMLLSPSQVTAIQLLCGTAAGILDLRRRVDVVRAVQSRSRQCLAITAEVHGVHNLSEFEGRVKLLATKFFNVATARLCFYDADSQELVTSTIRGRRCEDGQPGPHGHHEGLPSLAAVGRRSLTRFSVRHGVVGRCARKQAVVHLERVMASPFISETADGVDINGREGEVNMLAGPMVARFADGSSQVVGVLQLLDKKRRPLDDPLAALEQPEVAGMGGQQPRGEAAASAAGMSAPSLICDPFTAEDQDFFAEVLRILGLAALRTVQAQHSEAVVGGGVSALKGLDRLLAAV